MNPRLVLIMLAGVVAVVVASAVPAGSERYDITVSVEAEWTPGLDRWSLGALLVEEEPSKLVSFHAIFSNLLGFFSSDSMPVIFTLETTSGTVIDTVEQETSGANPFDTSKTLRVVHRNVEPGDYVLRARIVDGSGGTLDEKTRSLRIIPEADE